MGNVLWRGSPTDPTPGSLPWYRAGGAPAPVEAWDAEGAATYALSLVGLVIGTILIEIGGGPINWAAGIGWSGFRALSRCLDTGIVPPNDQTWSLILKFAGATDPTAAHHAAGRREATATGSFGLAPAQIGYRYYLNGSGYARASPIKTDGIVAVAGNRGYNEGIIDDGIIPAGAGIGTLPIYIGGRNNTIADAFFNGAIAKVAVFDYNIAAFVAAITAAM